MWWVIRRHQRAARDRGAVAIIVAVLMAFGLLGVGAIAIDTGSWYAKKAQLQNGADSAALAIAQLCAKTPAACTLANAMTIAQDRANNNDTSYDGAVHLDSPSGQPEGFVCGSGGLGACPGSLCPTGQGNYVDVQTWKSVPALMSHAPPIFRTTDEKIHVCAQARWGAPATLAAGAAMTISACDWLENTNNGTTFAKATPTPPSFLDSLAARKVAGINFTNAVDPNTETTPDDPPGPGAAVAGSETVLTTHNISSPTNPCSGGHPGWDFPGHFGWLGKGSCTVSITNNEYPGSPGNAPADCNTAFNYSRNTQTPIFLPVYSSVDPSTGNYVLYGFAAFVVTGWDINQAGAFSPKVADSVISVADGVTPAKDRSYCGSKYTGSNSDVCIYGYFTQALISAADLPGGTGGNNLGAVAPFLTG